MIPWHIRLTLAALSLAFSGSLLPAGERLIVCGGPEVFIIPADADKLTEMDRLWRWRAADSPEIPAEMHAQFRTTDECKPAGDSILITSSSGGVALIRRKDRKCLFYTSARNAHSACLVPGERVAVASSHGGDELLLFDLGRSGAKAAPLTRMKLDGAHGVLWDAGRKRLWALGTTELLLIELRSKEQSVEFAVEKKWELPTSGGHDLYPAADPGILFVTTIPRVYRFDTREGAFAPQPTVAEERHIKSIDQHPRTRQIAYHQGTDDKAWWSDTIRFLEPGRTLRVPEERLYKVRWDVER
ncbi:MAG: hypothetical protein JNM56_04445 [Planctomycetia bacterium]|nr:hypothetical protein [Planctomycetia bacterium]